MKKLLVLTSSLIFSIAMAGDFGGYSIFEYDADAFDMKRVYLKYSDNISDDLQFKLTYDIGRDDDGSDATSDDTKLSSYVKHAHINWNKNIGSFSIGLIGTNSYGVQEKTWGYRFIQKSPLDSEGWTNTADFGIGYSRSFGDININAQVLNGEGYKREQEGKDFAIYLRLLYGENSLNKNDGFNVGLALNNHGNDQLVALFGGWAKDKIRTGLEYNRLDDDEQGTSKVMIANYFNYTLSDKWGVFMRNDRTELVGGDTNTDTYLGAVWKAHENLHIAPTINMSNDSNDFKVSCMFKY